MQPFQIEGQANQTPFPGSGRQPTQGELAKAEHFFDDADDGFYGAFPQPIDGLADPGLKNPLSNAAAWGFPSCGERAARVGSASRLSLGWLESDEATINKLAWSVATWTL